MNILPLGRKLKCNGARPRCGHCVKRGGDCEYSKEIRRRGPGKKQKLIEARPKKTNRRITGGQSTTEVDSTTSLNQTPGAGPSTQRVPRLAIRTPPGPPPAGAPMLAIDPSLTSDAPWLPRQDFAFNFAVPQPGTHRSFGEAGPSGSNTSAPPPVVAGVKRSARAAGIGGNRRDANEDGRDDDDVNEKEEVEEGREFKRSYTDEDDEDNISGGRGGGWSKT